MDVADPVDGRGLAVRAGDGDELVGQQPPGELELAENLQPGGARGGHDGGLRGHSGTLDDRADTAGLPSAEVRELREAIAREVQLDAVARQRACGGGRAAVDSHDALSVRAQCARDGDPGAREPHDQIGARWDRWPWLHRRQAIVTGPSSEAIAGAASSETILAGHPPGPSSARHPRRPQAMLAR